MRLSEVNLSNVVVNKENKKVFVKYSTIGSSEYKLSYANKEKTEVKCEHVGVDQNIDSELNEELLAAGFTFEGEFLDLDIDDGNWLIYSKRLYDGGTTFGPFTVSNYEVSKQENTPQFYED